MTTKYQINRNAIYKLTIQIVILTVKTNNAKISKLKRLKNSDFYSKIKNMI